MFELVIDVFNDFARWTGHIREASAWVYIVALFTIGALFCFAGVIVWHAVTVITFGTLGAVVGGALADGTGASVVAGIVGFALAAWIAYALLVIGVFAIGGLFGLALGATSGEAGVAGISGIVGGIIAIILINPVIVVTTALSGAAFLTYVFMNAVVLLETGELGYGRSLSAYLHDIFRKTGGDIGRMTDTIQVDLAIYAATALAGMIVQGILIAHGHRAQKPARTTMTRTQSPETGAA